MKLLHGFTPLLAAAMVAQACQQNAEVKTPAPTETAKPAASNAAPAAWLVVNSKAEATLFGRLIEFENLPKMLLDSLSKMATIPDEISIKWDGEVGMGTRHEVETQASEAISAAKAARQKPVLEALRLPVEKAMTIPVELEVSDFRRSGEFAFVAATMRQKGGKPMNFSKTPFKKEAKAGVFTDSVFGLLHFENGEWKVVTKSIGPTDLPIVCWWKEFNAPKDLFDKDLIGDCQ